MLDKIPDIEELAALVGQPLFEVWTKLCAAIDEKYDMECLWNSGGKAWDYEYKYRRGGKTMCALYARKQAIGFMIIFGKDERAKFEVERDNYSEQVQKARRYGSWERMGSERSYGKILAGYPCSALNWLSEEARMILQAASDLFLLQEKMWRQRLS